MFQQFFIILLGIIGFLLSSYMYGKIRRNERLVCMLGEDCNKVVYSRYAITLGIPNTLIGMFYYSAIAVSYGFIIIVPQFQMPFFLFALRLVMGLAAFFSIYLIFVQIIMLKEWCEWCLLSTLLSVVIFVLAFF